MVSQSQGCALFESGVARVRGQSQGLHYLNAAGGWRCGARCVGGHIGSRKASQSQGLHYLNRMTLGSGANHRALQSEEERGYK